MSDLEENALHNDESGDNSEEAADRDEDGLEEEGEDLGPDKIQLRVHEIFQPIGPLYFGAIPHNDLVKISYSDIRRIGTEKRDIEAYLGIERPLRRDRVAELEEYVNTVDATFPSSIILAIDSKDTRLDRNTWIMSIRNDEKVAKILDGQHRIAGLAGFEGDRFDVLVTIFVEMDIEFQAMVFATINLEQTKVNRSLAYDLFAYATTRSPQKTAHNIARLLNSRTASPFHSKIKILGVSSNRTETISQALFVDSLMELISTAPNRDRDILRRGQKLDTPRRSESRQLVFRKLFIDEQDGIIARVLWNYFGSVERKWDIYWKVPMRGHVLNRTTGFKGLMQFLPFAFVAAGGLEKDPIIVEFDDIFSRINIEGSEITSQNYPPGTTGAARFRDFLLAQARLG